MSMKNSSYTIGNRTRDLLACSAVEYSWNVMAHDDAREGKWRGNWRMEWIASTLHTTSYHGVSSITTADAHTSAASSRLNWRPRRFKWTRPFRRKTKSGFCACAITFQTQSINQLRHLVPLYMYMMGDKGKHLCTLKCHMGEWRYSCTYSSIGQQIKASGQPYAPAALPPIERTHVTHWVSLRFRVDLLALACDI